MKTFNRIISLLMVVLMLATSVPYTVFTASAADDGIESYTLTLESNPVDSFVAENSAEGMMSFFGDTIFDGCYGNQLSGVARELYDSIVKTYATNKRTVEYTHAFETPFTFSAEISGGSIVMNDELEEIQLELDYAMQAAMDAFLYDHPEVFWLRIISSSYGISASGNSVDGYVGEISDITIVPTEIYDGASSKASQYTSAVEAVLDDITVTENRYDTLKNIHDYICNNAWYNLVSEQKVHSSEPFFIGDGGVVCEGYAKTFKVICDRLEIPCVLVSGDAGGAHMWNYVQMDDGKWYLVDATWDDQESQIYDTYFLANANTIGFDDVAISEERTESTDFSGTGIFSFTYPVLSTTDYIVHIHQWDSEYTVDVEPTCTKKGSKSIHCTVGGCNATKDVTEIDVSDEHNYENYICSYCGGYDEQNLIDYGQCGENVYYTLDKAGCMRIFGEGEMYDYNDLDQTNKSPWYNNRLLIKRLTVESGVMSIDDYSFRGCTELTYVMISDDVTSIGEEAFSKCKKLGDIKLPSGLTSISRDLFYDCVSLTSIEIPESVTTIGSNAFAGCESLANIKISDSVTNIGIYAFYGTDYYNDNEKWQDGVLYIGNHLIEAKRDIFGEYVIKQGTKTIADYAFQCSELTNIIIADSVRNIGEDAFSSCNNLISVRLPDSVETIGMRLFYEAENLKDVSIGDGLKEISFCAFYRCINLETISLGNNIAKIDKFAFEYCMKLDNVVIPNSVEEIEINAFACCYDLKKVVLGDSLSRIGYKAFWSCEELESIYIPKSVKTIESAAFLYCDNLKKIYYEGNSSEWNKISKSNYNDPLLKASLFYNHIHSYSESLIQSPTCYVEGEKKATCICGSFYFEEIPAVNHSNSYLVEKIIPTCTEFGYEAGIYCPDCDVWIEGHNVITALGHNLSGWSKNNDSTHTRSCSLCDFLETTDCTYTEWTTVKLPICFDEGVKVRSCTVCGNSEISMIEKTDHTPSTIVVENRVEPKCEIKGRYDEVVYCSVCNTEISRTTKEIAATGHKWNAGIINPVSTCKTHGTKTYTCQNDASHKKTEQVALDGNNHEGGTYLKNKADATCTADGYTGDTYCSGCNVKLESGETIDSLTHDMSDWKKNDNGTHIRTCERDNCDHTETENCTYTEWNIIKSATCTETGSKSKTCTVCGYVVTEQVDFDTDNHEGGTYVVGKVDATYVEEGYTGDIYCSGCNEKIASGEAIPEVTVPDIIDIYPKKTIKVILKAGGTVKFRVHSLDDYEETSYNFYISGITNYNESWYDEKTGKTPDGGGAPGEFSFVHEKDKTYIITIKSRESIDKTISLYVRTHTHNDYFVCKELPGCDYNGYDVYRCISCGRERYDNFTPSIGHDWDEGVIDIVPTCNTRGIKRYTCLNDESHVKEIDLGLDKSNHIGETYFVGSIEATCISDGYTGDIYCFDCYGEVSKGEVIKALGHNEESHEAKAPTCTEIGWDAYVTCSRCDYTTYAEKAVLGHKESEAVKEKEVSATCTAIGSYDMVVYCSVCGEELSRETEIVSATGHSYETSVTAPTCEENGYTTYTCACGDTYISDEIAAIGHNYVNNTTPATLASNGEIESKCSFCGDVESSQTITKIGSVTLSAEKYVHDGKNKTPKVTVKDADGNTLVKNVDYKTSVASKRSGIGKYTVKVTFIGNYEGSKNVYFTILPDKPATIKAASQTTTSVKLSWSEVSGAAGYTVYRYSPSKSAYVKAGTTEGTSFTVKSLYSATEYTFKVVAYGKTSGGKVYDSESYALLNIGTMPGKPSSVKSASQTTSSVKLSWSAVTRATGYNVYRYSPSKKAYVKAGSTTGTSYTVKSLYDGTKYTFRVVPYFKTSDGTIIESSSYALLKTATKTNTPTLSKVASSSKGKATLTWSAVDGEKGYTVYYSTKKDSGFKKYANFKADSKTGTATGLTSGKTYYFKVRTYITTDSGYVYSAWSTVKSVKVK